MTIPNFHSFDEDSSIVLTDDNGERLKGESLNQIVEILNFNLKVQIALVEAVEAKSISDTQE